ncbi:MAG: amidase [Thermomicrobiales bacterium]|jgi:amidase|nr:amidase [Thermomicrobiales bacterium]
MTQDLTNCTAIEIAALIRNRAISPVESTRFFLERIERIDPQLNAFISVTADKALARARDAEQQVMAGDGTELGPFHGVPIAIKELANVAGERSTGASGAFANRMAEEDDEGIARLFRAGAIMLGKTNSPEFGLNATTEDGIFPPTRNPWNTNHSAGGSSGGSGAALAARLVPFAEGSDGGGSIRIPASACGLVGLKPSRCRVPSAPHAGLIVEGFASSGPMARTVADAALGLDVMGGPAVGDPFRTELPAKSFSSAIGETLPKLRIAWTATSPTGPVDAEVAAAVERTRDALSDLGHELVEGFPEMSGLWPLWPTIANAFTASMDIENPDLLGPHARSSWDDGIGISARDYIRARNDVYTLTRRILAWFDDYDVLVCPTLTRPPVPLGELNKVGQEVWDLLAEYIPFTYWVNMTGQPGISLPLAWSKNGLPIGVQIVGRQLDERTLITLAAQLEQIFPWADRRPPVS